MTSLVQTSTYLADANRYKQMPYRRSGASGLLLPAISLGLWHNFGDTSPLQIQRDILRAAFDAGIIHFDLANNYGPPAGSAEENFGRILREDFAAYRDEIVISTKAGYDMWPGPYGQGGGTRKYVLASLDQSLERMGLDYVDIFYSHRFDPATPLEETMGALASAVQQGKALYVGVSSYSPEKTRQAQELLEQMGVPCTIHQPSYSLLNRWIEKELLATLTELGIGCIGFSALAQGLLSEKYISGNTANARINKPGGGSIRQEHLSADNMQRIAGLAKIAKERGQTLPQMAIAWSLRHEAITSTLIGASSVTQLKENLGALTRLQFSDDELRAIDSFAEDSNINLWVRSSNH